MFASIQRMRVSAENEDHDSRTSTEIAKGNAAARKKVDTDFLVAILNENGQTSRRLEYCS